MNFSTKEHKTKTKLNIKGILVFLTLVVVVFGLVVFLAFGGNEDSSSSKFPSTVATVPETHSGTQVRPPSIQYENSSRNFELQQEATAYRKGEMVVTSPIGERVDSGAIETEPKRVTVPKPQRFEDTPIDTKEQFQSNDVMDKRLRFAEGLIKSWKVRGIETEKSPFVSTEMNEGSNPVTTPISTDTTNQITPIAKPSIQAGEFLYAESLTAANSDVPAAIRFDLIGHPLGKAWIIANYTRKGKFLDIRANLLVIEGRAAIPIDAVVISMSGSPAMRNSINNRYIEKYGLPAIARFIQGFGAAAAMPQQSISITGSGATELETSDLSLSQQALAGASAAAETIADDLTETAAQIQPLVKLKANEPVQIFFLKDVYVQEVN